MWQESCEKVGKMLQNAYENLEKCGRRLLQHFCFSVQNGFAGSASGAVAVFGAAALQLLGMGLQSLYAFCTENAECQLRLAKGDEAIDGHNVGF